MADTSLHLTPNVLRESSRGIQAVPIRDVMFDRREIECVGAIDERTAFLLTRNPETLQRRLYGDDAS